MMSEELKPFAYRPHEHDDWGFIRSADGGIFATTRHPYTTREELSQHRHNGTDPYESTGKMIVDALNNRTPAVSKQDGDVAGALKYFEDNPLHAPDVNGHFNVLLDTARAALATSKAPEVNEIVADIAESAVKKMSAPVDVEGLKEREVAHAKSIWCDYFSQGDEREIVRIIDRLAEQGHLSQGWQPPDGWVLVPVEPTEDMMEAMLEHMQDDYPDFIGEYKAALAAAPKPPQDNAREKGADNGK